VRDELGPGPWLRACAAFAAIATGIAAASGTLGLTHRALVGIALPPLVAVALAAWQSHPRLRLSSYAAVAAFVGASVTWWLAPVHVGLASVAFAASAVTAALTFRREGAEPRSSWRDYMTLTKPRIMSLLLVTGAAGMFVGAGGVPELAGLAVMLLGLGLACGGASALNHLLDRDIDKLMGKRTEKRPVAAGRVPPARALEFGLALSAASFVVLAAFTNVLTAILALVGNLFYVLVYTRWLKRSTAQNIVIGGAAGAVPPLVGYAAATGSLALPALWLFLIVFLWTPPHFWALALLIKDNYAAAKVPMLPVVRGDRETARQIVLYSIVLVAFTLAVTPWLGPLYGLAAAALGAALLWLAWELRRDLSRRRAAVLFHYSLAYLALLFAAAALDPVVFA
jgi:protoheme IX farnesyltransferase